MQDQGKRLLFAVVLMLGVLLLWQKLFPQPAQPKKPARHRIGLGASSCRAATANKPTSPVGFSDDVATAGPRPRSR